jgi:predicted phage tail component-like protein
MFTLKIENEKGNKLRLTQNEDRFQVLNVDGLNPSNAQINRTTAVGMDGSKFNSSKLTEKNIVITIKLNGDIEKNRIELYKYFSPKQWCKIYYTNQTRNVYIEGYVETTEVTPFTDKETIQISILCPDPYFKNLDEITEDISKSLAMFEFPFSIETSEQIPFSEIEKNKITNVINNSESKVGMTIVLNIINPVRKIILKNTTNGETLTLNYTFLANDNVTINTNKGKKSIKLLRNGTSYNIFNTIQKGSKFFQLEIGDNLFSYLADEGESDGNVEIIFKHNTIYQGV